ncbi:hypothetical protein R83H12_00003 [Fibrobacteria bacterium R8-3-H12]
MLYQMTGIPICKQKFTFLCIFLDFFVEMAASHYLYQPPPLDKFAKIFYYYLDYIYYFGVPSWSKIGFSLFPQIWRLLLCVFLLLDLAGNAYTASTNPGSDVLAH